MQAVARCVHRRCWIRWVKNVACESTLVPLTVRIVCFWWETKQILVSVNLTLKNWLVFQGTTAYSLSLRTCAYVLLFFLFFFVVVNFTYVHLILWSASWHVLMALFFACCCSLCFEFQLHPSDSVGCEFHSVDGYVTFSEGVPVFILLIVIFRRRIIQKAQRAMPSTWPRSWWQGILVNLPTSSGKRPSGAICVELVELHQVGLSSLACETAPGRTVQPCVWNCTR